MTYFARRPCTLPFDSGSAGQQIDGDGSWKLSDSLVWGMRIGALLAIALFVYMTAKQQYQVHWLGDVSPFTLALVAVLFILAERSLSYSGAGRTDAVLAAVLFAFACIQTYELVYHFTFPVYLNYFEPPYINGTQIRVLILTVLTILPVLLFRKYLSFKWMSAVLLAAFITLWTLWILYGFPQCRVTGTYYLPLLETTDTCGLAVGMTFTCKTILAAFYVSLLPLGPAFDKARNYVGGASRRASHTK